MQDSYADRLRDPRWQRLRLEVMQRDGFSCTLCGDSTSTLHVHHRYYERGRDPWEYPLDSLRTLCERCHEGISALTRALKDKTKLLDERVLPVLVGFVEFLLKHQGETSFVIPPAEIALTPNHAYRFNGISSKWTKAK